MAAWEFWVVLLFDIALLIMRDADLVSGLSQCSKLDRFSHLTDLLHQYDDLGLYVKQHAGPLGELVLRIGELIVGPDMASVGGNSSKSARSKQKMDRWNKPPTEQERARVKRELAENW